MMKSREEEPEGRDSYTPSEASDLGAEQDFESFAREGGSRLATRSPSRARLRTVTFTGVFDVPDVTFPIFEGANPLKLAYKFCKDNNLPEDESHVVVVLSKVHE